MKLVEFLASKDFFCDPTLDGEYHRFDRSGVLSGWLRGTQLTNSLGIFTLVEFGDWKTGERYEWRGEPENLLAEDRGRMEAELEAHQEKRKEAKAARQEEVARACQERWQGYTDRGLSPYLEKKGLGRDLLGCKLYPTESGILTVVPMRDVDDKLWGLQYVHEDGRKNFTAEQRIRGCGHLLGAVALDRPLLVAEGLATAGSLHQATGHAVVAAFNAGNLGAVAEAYAARYPGLPILVCGDDDVFTTRQGKPWNPGREAAVEAARRVRGGRACCPRFADLSTHPTDFNDLVQLEGPEVVSSQIEEGLKERLPASIPQGEAGDLLGLEGLTPLPWVKTKTGSKPPPDQDYADTLLVHYGLRIVKQEKDLFIFVGTHWRHLGLHETDRLLQQLQHLYRGRATSSKLKGIYELFLQCAPPAPVDMFVPNPTASNFLNGTLHAVRASDYKYTLEFRPHSPQDFVTTCIPLKYEPEKKETNDEFLAMLDRVFTGDPDREQKIRSVRQMYGACLMPLFPHLFLLHGPQGSGKSSLIIPAQKLVHGDNWSSVEPHEFKGFNMETLVGKLVNIVTDINLTVPMDDANLKKIEDRVPIRIDRKFLRAVYAPLPAIHIFGANGIPPTLDGASGAHTRRWTFIEVAKYRATDGKYRKDFANWVFDVNPQGVLNFAFEGLRDLIQLEGHFTNPDSGVERLKEWQRESDQVASFIHDIGRKETDQTCKLLLHPGAKIRTPDLYRSFTQWATEVGFRTPLGRNKFRQRMISLGFSIRVIDGYDHYFGIGAMGDTAHPTFTGVKEGEFAFA